MKKIIKKMAGMALTGLLLWFPLAAQTSAAELDPIEPKKLPEKIMWGANELYPTQSGRLVFLKDVKLYKRDDNGVSFHRVAKKGSMWRVYNFRDYDTIYNLGGGVRVLKSNLSKYESADGIRARLQGSAVVNKIESNPNGTYQYYLSYPQISELANKSAEKSINTFFLNIANEVKKEQQALAKQPGQDSKNYYDDRMNYDVTYNRNNKISIRLTRSKSMVKDGHWEPTKRSTKTYNFNLSTGKQIYLKDFLTTKEQIEKVNNYLKARSNYTGGIDVNRDEFYIIDQYAYSDNEELPPTRYQGIILWINDPNFTGVSEWYLLEGSIFIPKEIYN